MSAILTAPILQQPDLLACDRTDFLSDIRDAIHLNWERDGTDYSPVLEPQAVKLRMNDYEAIPCQPVLGSMDFEGNEQTWHLEFTVTLKAVLREGGALNAIFEVEGR